MPPQYHRVRSTLLDAAGSPHIGLPVAGSDESSYYVHLTAGKSRTSAACRDRMPARAGVHVEGAEGKNAEAAPNLESADVRSHLPVLLIACRRIRVEERAVLKGG